MPDHVVTETDERTDRPHRALSSLLSIAISGRRELLLLGRVLFQVFEAAAAERCDSERRCYSNGWLTGCCCWWVMHRKADRQLQL